MSSDYPHRSVPSTPPRLWPGVVLLVLQWLLRFVLPLVAPSALIYGMLGALACGLGILIWWLFFSRAPWFDRLVAFAVMLLAVLVTSRFVHPSIANGMMGMMLPMYSLPVLCLALVAWAAATRHLAAAPRAAWAVTAMGVAAAIFTLLRTGGMMGDGESDLHWRWTPTPEDKLLAEAATAKRAPAVVASAGRTPEWPGFRGAGRDGIAHAARIATDWSTTPPSQVWRRPVGPGWSSFAVSGDVFYTQEQRGEDELVSCYKLATGEPVWEQRTHVRFWESNAGAGPRATPTLHEGRVYTFGGTGVLNVINAADGTLVWSRNAAAEAHAKLPDWGFAGSPLVVDDLVVVAAGGKLAGYDKATGKLRWLGPARGGGYSSPHWAKIHDVPQVLLLSSVGATSVAPATGKVLWRHAWSGMAIVQPALTADGDVLINTCGPSGGFGTRRLAVAPKGDEWTVEEKWTSNRLKPYFNDLVVHKGHAYGFDGNVVACIDLNDGERKWKGGRYGNGQLVLLADQDLLLVVSEKGELALVSATPAEFKELARFHGIEGKTWNHPVVVDDLVLVRNAEQMAAFRLPRAANVAVIAK